KIDVLKNRQSWVEIAPETLRHVSDLWTNSCPITASREIGAEHFDFAFLNFSYAGDQRKQGRFPHAIRTDYANHPRDWQFKFDPCQRQRLSVAMRYSGDARDDIGGWL